MVGWSLRGYLFLYQHDQFLWPLRKFIHISIVGVLKDKVIFAEFKVLMSQKMVFH